LSFLLCKGNASAVAGFSTLHLVQVNISIYLKPMPYELAYLFRLS
jgi:hypothetical protein